MQFPVFIQNAELVPCIFCFDKVKTVEDEYDREHLVKEKKYQLAFSS